MTDDEGEEGKGREQIIHEIANLLFINKGQTVEEFWYQVALAVKVGVPDDDTLRVAKQIFKRLDEEWDEDYEEEDGTAPSLEAYETLYELLKTGQARDSAQGASSGADSDSGDEEDDGIGRLEQGFNYQAQTTQTDIDTLLNRIQKGLLVLNPDWQRNFVWKLKKQRRLIESILLGLPIPSLLLFRESSDGQTYVIDGRQRLETITRFRSPKPKKGETGGRVRFKTFPRSTEGWGDTQKLHAAAGKYYADLPPEFKTQFDQAPLVLHTFIDLPREKLYQIFRRYNTGAEQLKAAEIRNAVYQASPLHEMMYRMAGERGKDNAFQIDDERKVAETLASIMKNKTARYGRYDFIGRYFAFSYMSKGSVANATNDFMGDMEKADITKLRDEFLRVFAATRDWYEYFLTTPDEGGKFHAFLATIQMVSTRHMLLQHVDAGRADVGGIKEFIEAEWQSFAKDKVLEDKQNSTNFWKYQTDWIQMLEERCVSKGVSAIT
jgi:hypothetical protein